MAIKNLLVETLEMLDRHGLTPDSVQCVGIRKVGAITWKSFARIANADYDSGFGGAMVNEGLLIIGEGWWLEREEYDGSEWWRFMTMPILELKRPKSVVKLIWNERY